MLKQNLVRYALIQKQITAFRKRDLELASRLLWLINTRYARVGLGDDVGFNLETIAEVCGCRIRYSRNYGFAYITF